MRTNDEDLEQKIFNIKLSFNERIQKRIDFEGVFFEEIINSIFIYFDHKYKSLNIAFDKKRKEMFEYMDKADEKKENIAFEELGKIQDKQSLLIEKLKDTINYHLRQYV